MTLRELNDRKGKALVDGVLEVVDRLKPLHLSIVGGDPLVRYRELEVMVPLLLARGVHVQIVTSAFGVLPPAWATLPHMNVVVSIDGLQPEHDIRRKPATYERILKNIAGQKITIHTTITGQLMKRPGYLHEFLTFWTPRSEIHKIWFSLFTPQIGDNLPEILTQEERSRVIDVALTGGILFLLARRRLRVTALIAIPILILADTFFAARRMYDNPSTALMYGSASRPESEILRSSHFDRDHYRLFPVDFDIGPMARLTSTYHLSTIYPYPLLNVLSALPVINDYGPFWPKRYQAVTGFNAGGGMPIANLQNYKMLSFLGTRYLMVLSAETRQAIEKVTLKMESGRGATKVFSPIAVTPNGITIFENPTVLPRFRFVQRIRPAQDLDDALSWMNRPGFRPCRRGRGRRDKHRSANGIGQHPRRETGSDGAPVGS